MNKIRIYELAKKLGVANKVILTEIAKLGIEGKTHASSIEPDLAGKIESVVLKKTAQPAKEQPPLKKKEKPVQHPAEAAAKKHKAPVSVEEKKPAAIQPAAPAPEEKKPEPEAEIAAAAEDKTSEVQEAIVPPPHEEEDELKIPDKYKKETELEKIEKFKAKPGMQRAFQTIRKIEPKRWGEQRPVKRGGRTRPFMHEERKPQVQLVAPRKKTLKLQEGTTVKEFAELISVKISDVIKKFMELGYMPTINQPVDTDAALLIAENFGVKVELAAIEEDAVRGRSARRRCHAAATASCCNHHGAR